MEVSTLGPAQILGVRGDIHGVYLSVRCRSCSQEFEAYLPCVGGFPVGVLRCSLCSAGHRVDPARCIDVLEDSQPTRNRDELIDLMEIATQLTLSWHDHPKLDEVLSYKGVALGPPTERQLLPLISTALTKVAKRETS